MDNEQNATVKVYVLLMLKICLANGECTVARNNKNKTKNKTKN